MHSIEIPDKNLTIELPSSWDDCTHEQAHYILERAFAVMDGTLSIGEFRLQVFRHLAGLKTGITYLIRQRLGLNTEANARIYQLSAQLCSWIFEKQEDNTYQLQFETVHNFFPVLLEKEYGPQDLLADLTLGEFKTALSALDQYFECKENEQEAQEYLHLFLATIYRPKYEDTGEKVPFHQYFPHPPIFEKVPMWQKQCIVIWFSYCVKCLQSEELTINGIDIDLSVLFPQSKGSSNRKINLGWTGVLLDIAESGVFGDATTTSRTPLYDVLIYLLKKHQDQKQHDNRKKV